MAVFIHIQFLSNNDKNSGQSHCSKAEESFSKRKVYRLRESFFVVSSPNSFLKRRHKEKMTSRHRKDLFLVKIPSNPSIAHMKPNLGT